MQEKYMASNPEWRLYARVDAALERAQEVVDSHAETLLTMADEAEQQQASEDLKVKLRVVERMQALACDPEGQDAVPVGRCDICHALQQP